MSWPPHQQVNKIEVFLDGTGAPVGATVHRRWDEDAATHTPMSVSPFDTPDEVWERCKGALDVQLTLW